MDPNVGKEIEMLVCAEDKCEIIDKNEIEKLKALQVPLSINIIEEQTRTVEEIVRMREEINNIWKDKFGFKLSQSNEMAVLQIMRPCRTDEEFTSNISALALLIDLLNIREMKKAISEKEGSINIFEEFSDKNDIKVPSAIMSNFRDIVTLRSKRFPTHVTDPKFVELAIKLDGKYPPDLSDLYLKALGIYKESLRKLLEAISPSEAA